MSLPSLLASLVARCQRAAALVVLAGLALALVSALVAGVFLGISTDTDAMFSSSLPWRQQAMAFDRDFPQLRDQLVVVIDASLPEEADAAAAALVKGLANDVSRIKSVTRPDTSPFFTQEGLLFLDKPVLQALLDQTVDAQPFIGQLVEDPSARGLFTALGLIGLGATRSNNDLSSYDPSLAAFHDTIASVLAPADGKPPQPLSWQTLLGGKLADLGGKYRFVIVQPKLDNGALQPGGAATAAIRQAAAAIDLVRSGQAHVRITGSVALADEEFATVADGAVRGLLISLGLITLWLFLAVRTWRLIVPILLTLILGLMLTVLFAALAVGTLNLVSVGFGVLFVGIAVDFSIQFTVRYREMRFQTPDIAQALRETGLRAGVQILVAAAAIAAGFLAFVPTDFSGVAELGLIAGIGMLIAFLCTMTFLPAAISLCRPGAEGAEIGFTALAPMDRWLARHRDKLLPIFAALAVMGAASIPGITFDSDPLHTKDPSGEAMRTLQDLMADPANTPYSADIMVPSAAAAADLADTLAKLPLVAAVRSINSLVPDQQPDKIATIADAESLLAPTLQARTPTVPPTPADIRLAATNAEAQIAPALAKLPPTSQLITIDADLKKIIQAPDATLTTLQNALIRFLPAQLDQLRGALTPQPVTIADIPKSLSQDWLLPDGRARVQAIARPEARDSEGLRAFLDQVRTVAPNAGGAVATIVGSADTIISAFRTAAIYALIAIAGILFAFLRRLTDTALVMAPLLLSALLTVVFTLLLRMPINFANIIALPLLLGVGVSFNIYFVMNWRAGREGILASATARAVMFSALTTGSAFGSLALSHHPGTASMGKLLLASLAATLIASLLFVPTLLATIGKPKV